MGEDKNRELCEVIDGMAERTPIVGVVRQKGLHDELGGDMFAGAET